MTDAPLVACGLSATGGVTLEHVTQVHVWGYAGDGRKTRVYVMNEEEHPAFASGLHQLALAAHVG